MIVINEIVRINMVEKGYNHQGIIAINSAEKLKNQCTWVCHENTNYCKENHVKLVKPYFEYIDPVYFGIISSLKSTGHYGVANVLFLVVLIPMAMYLLLIKSVNLQLKISRLKENQKKHD